MTSTVAPATTQPGKPLAGRTALFLGGSSGVGLAAAGAAQHLGADVRIAGRDPQRLAAAREVLGDVATTQIDATDIAAVTALLAATRPEHVVLSTGEALYGAVAETEVDDVLDWVSSRIAPLLTVARWAAQHPGTTESVTLVGGAVLRTPVAGLSSWAFVGPGLVGLVANLAVEVAPTRVNEVGPTMIIDSPRGDPFFPTTGAREVHRAELTTTNPAAHAITVADVARQVLGFMTDPAITGTIRTVDAGASLI